jgi:para-nitrobenzyl esterase
MVHGAYEGTVRTFLGIPYAQPPVGDLRWRTPQPVTFWKDTLEAVQIANQCPQLLSYAGPSYDEDCLYLNVWAPKHAKQLPVMVWLHGGAFIFGSGGDKYYDSTNLAEHGVVVVTLNYRLGALGFLSHPALDTEDPMFPTSGNYGLEDQRFALQWVQRNIAAFGGDPANVTLFGESAGGFSTCVHYLSSRADGLFANAIAESGFCGTSFLAPTHSVAESQALTLATKLGCAGNGSSALACLRGIDPMVLLQATALPPASSMMPGGPFYQPSILPTAVPNIDGVVIAMPTREAFDAHAYMPRPLLLGNNKDEGSLFHSSVYALPVTTNAEYQAALAVRFGPSQVNAIVAQYPIASYASANDAIAHVTGDAFFVCPSRRTARAALAAGAPVFRYSFEQPMESVFMQGLGVFHGAELPFVFGNDDFPLGHYGASGAPVSTAMQDYWTTFAKTGDPNGASEPPWAAYDGTTDPYQVLATPIASATGLKTSLCDFWDAQPIN